MWFEKPAHVLPQWLCPSNQQNENNWGLECFFFFLAIGNVCYRVPIWPFVLKRRPSNYSNRQVGIGLAAGKTEVKKKKKKSNLISSPPEFQWSLSALLLTVHVRIGFSVGTPTALTCRSRALLLLSLAVFSFVLLLSSARPVKFYFLWDSPTEPVSPSVMLDVSQFRCVRK